MIDLLRMLLDLREKLIQIEAEAKDLGMTGESLPQVLQMQMLERKAFEIVSEWEKPS